MSWQNVKLGDLCTIEKGKTGIQKAVPGEFPLVVTAEERKTHNEYQFDDEAVIIPLVSGTGHGHASIKRLHFQSGKFALGSILCAVIPKDKSILNAEYLYRFLNLNKERELVDRMKGMANVTLPIKEIAKIEIPLPSLKEQIEFVEKYALLETDSEDISFELEHQLDLIKQLRQAFLREAMQGKLVGSAQLKVGGETGHDLLAKIKTEKQKSLPAGAKRRQEKELPPITEDEIPFEIPEHWAWCRLGEICDKIIDCPHSTPKYLESETGFFGIDTNCIDDRNQIYKLRNLSEDQYNERTRRSALVINDIIFAREGSIGKAVILTENKKICLGQRVMMFRPSKVILPKFLLLLTTSPKYLQKLLEKHKGMGAKHVNVKDVVASIIPLPPLHEQEQIVAKLEELMAFCDGLEQSVQESQGYNEKLLQQVLREALQPKGQEEQKINTTPKLSLGEKTILAAHIINQCNTTDFGRVKFQKILFLVEYHCQLNLDSQYIQKAAGPHDDALIRSIESEFNRHRFYKVTQERTDLHRVRYQALANAIQIDELFRENFETKALKINNLIKKLRVYSWEECETIATIFAVWNNRLLKGLPISDAVLYDDFIAWSPRKEKLKNDFYTKLFWMREENIVPIDGGWGNYIDKPMLLNLS